MSKDRFTSGFRRSLDKMDFTACLLYADLPGIIHPWDALNSLLQEHWPEILLLTFARAWTRNPITDFCKRMDQKSYYWLLQEHWPEILLLNFAKAWTRNPITDFCESMNQKLYYWLLQEYGPEIVLLRTCLTHIITFSNRYPTTATWSNRAALWSGVIFSTSWVWRAVWNRSVCISYIILTISMLPWALAKCKGVELSSYKNKNNKLL